MVLDVALKLILEGVFARYAVAAGLATLIQHFTLRDADAVGSLWVAEFG